MQNNKLEGGNEVDRNAQRVSSSYFYLDGPMSSKRNPTNHKMQPISRGPKRSAWLITRLADILI